MLALLLWPALAVAAGPPDAFQPVPAPIGWHDPAPLSRAFLQLPFEAPEVLAPGHLEASLRLLYSNSVLKDANGSYGVDVYVETAQPTAALRYGVARDVELTLALPFVADYGGFLDSTILQVESWFGAVNTERVGRARDQSWFVLTGPDGRGIDRRGTGGGVGDLWAGVKVLVFEDLARGRSVAVRAAVKVPTGAFPYGSEEVDVGGGVLAAWTWRATALRVGFDVYLPTGSVRSGLLATHPYAAANAGITHRLGGRVALQAQASAHRSPITGTGLHPLDAATAYVLGGASVLLTSQLTLQVAVVENIFSPHRGADITFPVALLARF